MISNSEISRAFSLYAELLLLHDQDEHLAALLSGAAYRIRRIDEDIITLDKAALTKLFKPRPLALIIELQKTATIQALDELVQLTPAGLFEMMRIRGLGGKKLSVLWKTAKIDTIEALLDACKKKQLSKIPGFGAKTEQNIIKAIENYNSNQHMYHYAAVADAADQLVTSLQTIFKTNLVSLTGDIRRQNTTVANIEIIAAIPSKKTTAAALRKHLIIQSSSTKETRAHTLDEIPVTIYHSDAKQFYHQLFVSTGSEKHVKKIITKIKGHANYTTEEDIYKHANMHFILPELREDVAEWDDQSAVGLVTLNDIKGVVHNHTTWSDGVHTLSEFVKACKKRSFEYVVISDHSKNAHYAGGLKEEKVLRQFEEIDAMNDKLAPFKIFKSIECDILVSGELDYNNDFLKLFDMVIISIHQLLKMDGSRATKRLIKAIENPYTTILGHMTGRQLLIRPGYPVDFNKVIDACAANKVVIEINANPYRLDMDWSHIPYAMKKGVMISVNPDAHSIGEIDNIRWGVSAARKGGLTKEMTWNAMPLTGVEQWLKNK
ncbi:MAG TPA: helix-hairpin-helix domain-containing protein [Flavitalea sp.]|nr:helix-hairpin-helix domain-containing protein [Flavitalea sp.]